MSIPNQTDFSKMIQDLIETHQRIKNDMVKASETLEKVLEKIQKKLLEFETALKNRINEIEDLKDRCKTLDAENRVLKQLRQELLDDLDQSISQLTKRRRLMAATLDSPQSPTYEKPTHSSWDW